MSNTAITWKTGQYSARYGFVGKTRVFSTVYGMVSGSDTPWQLKANLPGIKQNTEHATEQAAREAAETMLRIHLNSLLAAGVQTPELTEERVERAAQAIARTRLQQDSSNIEAAWFDENWELYWETVLTDHVRREYREQARAALTA